MYFIYCKVHSKSLEWMLNRYRLSSQRCRIRLSFFSSVAFDSPLLQNIASSAGKLEKTLIPEQPPDGKPGQCPASGKVKAEIQGKEQKSRASVSQNWHKCCDYQFSSLPPPQLFLWCCISSVKCFERKPKVCH